MSTQIKLHLTKKEMDESGLATLTFRHIGVLGEPVHGTMTIYKRIEEDNTVLGKDYDLDLNEIVDEIQA